MVWGVCRRLLGQHDAEDAFQATFLVLVRKAGSVVPREMLPNWLHGVAYQTALQARRTAARREARERQVSHMHEPAIAGRDQWDDLKPLLDEELSRLPDKYRVVIVLCDLEDKTRKDAARQLSLPVGTVASRLVRARAILAKRLTQRGVVLTGGAVAVVLSQQVASGVPPTVREATLSTASLVASGKTAGAISATVAALTEGVIRAMFLSRLKAAMVLVLLLGFLTTGASVLCSRTAGQDEKPTAVPAGKPEKEDTAWGQVVGGLQAGLGFRPGENRVYRHGDTAKLVVRVRNVSKQDINFQYLRHFFIENPPKVTDDAGKPVAFKDASPRGIYKPWDAKLEPGKEIELYELNVELSNGQGIGIPKGSTLMGTGRFSVQYERVLGNSFLSSVPIKLDPVLSKLATGKLKLEVKEAFTAWGQDVGGLQAGLSIRDQNNILIGGKATAVIWLRNVSKTPITASMYLEDSLVVDALEKRVRGIVRPAHDYEIIPTKITVPAGQTLEIAKSTFLVRAAVSGEQAVPDGGPYTIYVQPGKYRARFGGFLLDHHAVSTGSVEFKVNAGPPAKKQESLETAWGEEADGVQAGLGFRLGEHRAYHTGETVRLVVRVRNVGKKEAKIVYAPEHFYEEPPIVTDEVGKPVTFQGVEFSGEIQFKEVTLMPGKVVDLCELPVALRPANEKPNDRPWSLYEMGQFRLQFERVGGNIGTGEIKYDPILRKLMTGKLVLEVKEEPAPKDADQSALRGDEAKAKEIMDLVRELSMADVSWDGQWFGIVATLQSERAKRLAAVGEPAIPDLIRAMADEKKFASAHAILTTIAFGG
jgi:RNA polymerase sigma factor (sigma-70 family)